MQLQPDVLKFTADIHSYCSNLIWLQNRGKIYTIIWRPLIVQAIYMMILQLGGSWLLLAMCGSWVGAALIYLES